MSGLSGPCNEGSAGKAAMDEVPLAVWKMGTGW